jgi:hypothetical protein
MKHRLVHSLIRYCFDMLDEGSCLFSLVYLCYVASIVIITSLIKTARILLCTKMKSSSYRTKKKQQHR